MQDFVDRHAVDLRAQDATTHLVSALTECGGALVDGVDNPEVLVTLARRIGVVIPHRDSGGDGVTRLTDLGAAVPQRSGFAGFSICHLEPHTDRSGVRCPPDLLFLACGRMPTSGGECLLVDGKAVYEDLDGCAPEALQALVSPRCALFGGAAGYLGSVFTTTTTADGPRVTVRLRLDDLAHFNPTAVRALPALRAAIARHTTVLKLDRGQGYVLQNHRWFHGRRAFTGKRVMFRVHANSSPRIRIPAGFRPVTTASVA